MAKRKQVKNACVNCQRACKKCDDTRPCVRCVKYGIEETCANSSRKERKKGFKRGPYKSSKSTTSDSPVSDSSAVLPSIDESSPYKQYHLDLSDRPVRSARRRINYREMIPDETAEDGEGGEGGESEAHRAPSEAGETTGIARSKGEGESETKPKLLKPHMPLFNMVLGAMHGKRMVPPDQPSILELAAICTEVLDIERNYPEKLSILPLTESTHKFEDDRNFHNSTPLPAFIPRDVPTPPSTPLSTKPVTRLPLHAPPTIGGPIVAPIPIPAHLQQRYSSYSAYLSPE